MVLIFRRAASLVFLADADLISFFFVANNNKRSNWGDHCGMVAQACKENGKSVVTHRTPYGLKEADWRKGLDLYKKAHAGEQ